MDQRDQSRGTRGFEGGADARNPRLLEAERIPARLPICLLYAVSLAVVFQSPSSRIFLSLPSVRQTLRTSHMGSGGRQRERQGERGGEAG